MPFIFNETSKKKKNFLSKYTLPRFHSVSADCVGMSNKEYGSGGVQ